MGTHDPYDPSALRRLAVPTLMSPTDVILAVASPPGRSARGLIRLSGASTFVLLRDRLVLRADDPIGERGLVNDDGDHRASPRRQFPRGFHRALLRFKSFDIPALALVFQAPRSYTGEDAIELQLPGNPSLLEWVIDDLLSEATRRALAARRADPGEFTARAFLNGRLSLTQAEGVAATIAARSDAELRAAQILISGSLGEFAHSLADELASSLALVEAGIDFTDQEDVVAISPAELHRRLLDLHRRIAEQLRRAVGMEQLRAIPWVVLVGEPNAGKSALFNALLGRERAVVSHIAGTTRDVLTEPLAVPTDHGPAEVMLVDLAGFDESDPTSINRLMQSAAQGAIDRAELVLRCVPSDQTLSQPVLDHEVLVRTKSDMIDDGPVAGGAASRSISVSAVSGAGLEELRRAIADRLSNRAVSLAADALALRPRHDAALRSALANLHEAIELVAPVSRERSLANPELIAAAMRAALDDLASLAGDITPDDVLGRVFATFCVGK